MLSVTARLESSALDPVVPDLQGEFDGSMFLKVLAAATAGKYPCAELVYNQATGAWDNLPNEAKAFELNGATLSVGQILRGRQAGHDLNRTGGVCVLYAVQASGGGGAAGVEFAVLKVTSLLPPYTAKVQIPAGGGTTWSDGATVNFYLTHGEGSWLNLNFRYPAFKYGGSYVICLDPQVVTSVTCSDGNLIVKDRG